MKPETALAKLDQASKMLAEVRDADDAKHVMAVAEAVQVYAQKRGFGNAAIGRAVEVRLDAERLLGGFLAKMPKAKGGRPPKTDSAKERVLTLKDLNLKPKESSAAQKLAKMSDSAFRAFRDKLVATATGTKIPKDPEIATDDGDECYTPPEWVDLARDVLGGVIDLDPFSCAIAQRTVQAAAFFTKENSALDKDWNGRVWFQPPYSSPLIADAVNKLLYEIEQSRVTAVVGLTNTCTASAWWQTLSMRSHRVMFPRHRINFLRPIGGDEVAQQKGNRADQTFFYYGPDPHRFEYVFGEHGVFGAMKGNL